MARKIEVVDYNPQWAKEYKEEAKKIKELLGKNCVAIHHIGSTAVKGMKAKPVIDIMPIVKDLSLVKEQLSKFDALGYEYMGANGISDRIFFAKGGDNRTHHVHIFEEKNKMDTSRHLAVREYLCNHPEDVKEYSELKTRLAQEFTYDIEGYCNGKETYMKELEAKASKWAEQQLQQSNYISLGMCLGMAIGMAIGNVFGNMVLGMSLGLSLGVAAGVIVSAGKAKMKKIVIVLMITGLVTIPMTANAASKLTKPVVTVSNVASTGKLKISWKKVKNAKSYKVYRSLDKKNWKLIKISTGTSYTDKNAAAGKKYYYKVKAIAAKAKSNSQFSNIKSRVCDLARPVVTLKNNAVSGKIIISWGKISGAKNYKVYRSVNNKTWTLIKTTTGTKFVNSSATAEKKYYYRVKAISSKSSANSAFSDVKSRVCKKPQLDLNVTVSLNADGKPQLKWNKVYNAAEYRIYRSYSKNDGYKLLSTTAYNSFTNGGATEGLPLYYKVQAIDSAGKLIGTESSPVSVTVNLSTEEVRVKKYVLKSQLNAFELPDSSSMDIVLPYMEEVELGAAVTHAVSGKWYRLYYDNKLYYLWMDTNDEKLTAERSSIKYTGENEYQQEAVDLAADIALNWNTYYTHYQSNGVADEEGRYGFDCSGFASYVLNTVMQKQVPVYKLTSNITKLSETKEVYNTALADLNGSFVAEDVVLEDIQSGDIIFFSQNEENDHCGIYLGNNEFAHASSYWDKVCISPLKGNYLEQLSFIRRYMPEKVETADKVMYIKQICKMYIEKDSDSEVVYQFKKGESVTVLYTDALNWAYVRNANGDEAYMLIKNLSGE